MKTYKASYLLLESWDKVTLSNKVSKCLLISGLALVNTGDKVWGRALGFELYFEYHSSASCWFTLPCPLLRHTCPGSERPIYFSVILPAHARRSRLCAPSFLRFCSYTKPYWIYPFLDLLLYLTVNTAPLSTWSHTIFYFSTIVPSLLIPPTLLPSQVAWDAKEYKMRLPKKNRILAPSHVSSLIYIGWTNEWIFFYPNKNNIFSP